MNMLTAVCTELYSNHAVLVGVPLLTGGVAGELGGEGRSLEVG